MSPYMYALYVPYMYALYVPYMYALYVPYMWRGTSPCLLNESYTKLNPTPKLNPRNKPQTTFFLHPNSTLNPN